MNKIIRTIAFAAVAAAAITACNIETEISIPSHEQGEFIYTFALGDDAAMTKAILASDNNGKFAQWEEGDQLGSITRTIGYSNITPATEETPATFAIYSASALTTSDVITVWYPYDSSNKPSAADAVTLTIPSEQNHLSDGKFDFDAMPMVANQIHVTSEIANAYSSTNKNVILSTINLANIGSVLNFKVFSTESSYAGEKVKSITFNAKTADGSADAYIGGSFSMDLTGINTSDESTMAISLTAGTSTIVTSPYAPAAIGEDKDDALDLYMVVAPGTYTGTIVVKTDAAEYTYTLSSEKTFVRSGIRAFGLDLNSKNASRATVTDCVTLPWESIGAEEAIGESYLSDVAGVTVASGGYYANNTIKFNTDGNNIVIVTDSEIGAVTVNVKDNANGTTTSTSEIVISGSVDGTEWTEVQKFVIAGANGDDFVTTNTFASTARYVKIALVKKVGNAGIGRIAISKLSTDPIIIAEDITVPATGADSGIATYEARYFTDDVEVASEGGFSGCVTDALASDGEIIYDVAPNYTTSPVPGTIKLWSSSDHSLTKTINVTQTASVFEASSSAPLAFAWNDETNSVEKTVIITSTFAITKTSNVELSGTNADKFTVSLIPKVGSATEYTLTVRVNEDNETGADYTAVVTVSRNSIEIPISLSQAYKTNGTTVTDHLTYELVGITGTSYSNWSNKQDASDAVYAGNSSGNSGSISIRSTNSSGIVTTTSGGYVKSIVITFNSGCTSGRTVNVYGKNSSYTAVSDLYDPSKQGSSLGTIVCGTTTTINVAGIGNYTNIGLRSSSNAILIDDIAVTWGSEPEKEQVAQPEISCENNTVTITTYTDDASIYYTTDGTTNPSSSSTLYEGPFAIANTITVKAIALKDGFDDSEVATKECIYVQPKVATPQISIDDSGNVTMSCDTEGATIHYTTDGENPTSSSATYATPFSVSSGVTIKAIATMSGYLDSAVAEKTYSAGGGSGSTSESVVFLKQGYSNQQEITSYTGTDFTVAFDKGTNSNAPKYFTSGEAIRAYGGNYFTVSSSKTIIGIVLTFGLSDGSNAITANIGTYSSGTWSGSASSVTFTIGGTSGNRRLASITVTFAGSGSSTTVATPTFSVAEGTYNTAQTVTINCSTDGATIYYTTDGTTPTNSSDQYTSAVTVDKSKTIKAIAIKGSDESAVASATYTLKVATPSISPNGGSFDAAQNVTITCTTGDATIHYTIDKSTPSEQSSTYSGAISISETKTIKAIAVKTGWDNSEVASADFTIGGGGGSSFVPVTVWDDDFNGCTQSTTALTSLSGAKTGFTSAYSGLSYIYPEASAIKIASNSSAGSITTPAFSALTSTSTVTVTIQAKGMNNKTGPLTWTVNNAGTASKTSQTLTASSQGYASGVSSWDTVTFTITGATSATTITFNVAKKCQVFVNSINIVTTE